MRLTALQRRALEAARDGARREQLGDLLVTPDFVELINLHFVRCGEEDEAGLSRPVDVWELTGAGAAALETLDPG